MAQSVLARRRIFGGLAALAAAGMVVPLAGAGASAATGQPGQLLAPPTRWPQARPA